MPQPRRPRTDRGLTVAVVARRRGVAGQDGLDRGLVGRQRRGGQGRVADRLLRRPGAHDGGRDLGPAQDPRDREPSATPPSAGLARHLVELVRTATRSGKASANSSLSARQSPGAKVVSADIFPVSRPWASGRRRSRRRRSRGTTPARPPRCRGASGGSPAGTSRSGPRPGRPAGRPARSSRPRSRAPSRPGAAPRARRSSPRRPRLRPASAPGRGRSGRGRARRGCGRRPPAGSPPRPRARCGAGAALPGDAPLVATTTSSRRSRTAWPTMRSARPWP